MINTVSAQFLILIQHPVKSKFITNELVIRTGIVGSLLLDLLYENSIRIENNKLITTATETKLSYSHLQVLERLNHTSKTLKIHRWISKLSRRSSTYKKQLFEDLENIHITQIFRKKILFIPYLKTQLYNTELREDIIKELREFVLYGTPLTQVHPLLPGMIHSCRLHKLLCYDREERKICKIRLQEVLQKDPISENTFKVIQQMQIVISTAVGGAVAGVAIDN